jgi:hypothetical protein
MISGAVPRVRHVASCNAIPTKYSNTMTTWSMADMVHVAAYAPLQNVMACTVQHTFPMSLLEDDNDDASLAACVMNSDVPPLRPSHCDDDDDPCKLLEEMLGNRRRRHASSNEDHE